MQKTFVCQENINKIIYKNSLICMLLYLLFKTYPVDILPVTAAVFGSDGRYQQSIFTEMPDSRPARGAGDDSGGRNREMALSFLSELESDRHWREQLPA
jgi:hypothetical protein